MKRTIASVGILAACLAGFQADSEPNKQWSISASLRGFYDDNITTVPDRFDIDPRPGSANEVILTKEESFGIDITPSLRYHVARGQTRAEASYAFGGRWYQNRNPDQWDISHNLAGKLTHSASPGLSFEVADTLRIAQEPEVLTGNFLRSRGNQDYVHNDASIHATQQLRGTLSLQVGYINTLFEYDEPDFAVHLDRVEHTPLVHLKSRMTEDTVGLLGYRYKVVNYTGDYIFHGTTLPRFAEDGTMLPPDLDTGMGSDFRNSRSHYIYLGADHVFNPQMQGSVRAGLQHTRFPRIDESSSSPFVDANLTYGYAEGSNLTLGVKHERNRYDLANPYTVAPGEQATELILDQVQTVVYAGLNHRITGRLSGNLVVHYVNGSIEGGGDLIDGSNDRYWGLGLGLGYDLNEHLDLELGYNLDDYDSGVLPQYRSYDRNRVYLGLRASY